MASYQYLRDITPEELEPEKEPELTRRQKWNNWWHYHWGWVLAGCAAAALVLYFIYSMTLGRAPEPDYQVSIVSPSSIGEDVTAKLQTTFESYADDVNGDGRVLVQINVYTISYAAKRAAQSGSAAASAASGADSSGSEMGEEFLSAGTDAYAQMAGDIQLSTDLESSDTGIFILYDPAGFESYTSALRYLNGTNGETDADGYGPDDWYNMVYRWTDCPVLESAGLDSALGDYCIGFRGIWTDASQEALASDEVLWSKVTAGAVSTATAQDAPAQDTPAQSGAAQ